MQDPTIPHPASAGPPDRYREPGTGHERPCIYASVARELAAIWTERAEALDDLGALAVRDCGDELRAMAARAEGQSR
jgi:hypothetical protein